jgi:hypothetical protein
MSLREKLNKSSSLTTIASVLIIILAVALMAWQFWPKGYKRTGYTEMYYTTDDGQTYFAADRLTNIPPFDKDGKQAVQAQVVRCGYDKPFVGYMTRFNDQAKKALEEAKAKGELTQDLMGNYATQGEAKKPGDTEWVPWLKLGETKVATIDCPDGKTSPIPIYP